MRAVLLVCVATCVAAIVGGCSASPVSGRQQLNVLVEPIHTAYADLKFAIFATPRAVLVTCPAQDDSCTADPAAGLLSVRIEAIAARLAPAAAQLSPELAARIPRIEVFIAEDAAPGASSSPGGKIAVHTGVAALDLNEEELAFVVAREVGRLAHAHHREAASAGFTASLATNLALTNTTVASLVLLDFLVPWGALMKFAAAFGSSAAAQTVVERSQQEEADEFACQLLAAADFDLSRLRSEKPAGDGGLAELSWTSTFYKSRQWAAEQARKPATPLSSLLDPAAASPF